MAGTYGYLLIGLALLAGYLRITRADRMAQAHLIRRQSEFHIFTQKITGAALLLGAIALGVFAVMDRTRPWLWLACVVAALSGVQALASATLPADQLAKVIRAIGSAFVVLSVVIYFKLVHA